MDSRSRCSPKAVGGMKSTPELREDLLYICQRSCLILLTDDNLVRTSSSSVALRAALL